MENVYENLNRQSKSDTLIKKKVFFPNLDGVRALAALAVVISHIELHKKFFSFTNLKSYNLSALGPIGVTIFFVLSGFLITYLLIEEKTNFGKLSYTHFYLRRILRIWPLYFLIVFVGFFIYPKSDSTAALLMCTFFLPNLAFCLKLLPSIFDPIWSIGTEEQFYIFHPHFFRIEKLSKILFAMFFFLIIFYSFDRILKLFENKTEAIGLIRLFLSYARFDNMIWGAIFAILFYNRKYNVFNFKFQFLYNLLFNKYVQILFLALFGFYCFSIINLQAKLFYPVMAIISAVLIINLCEASTSIYSLNNRFLNYIGKISYGVYLLHKFPLFLVLYLTSKYLPNSNSIVLNLIIYTATIGLLILLATLSYKKFEKYFLNLKENFGRITK